MQTNGHAAGAMPIGLRRSSAWRHAVGSPSATGPRRPSPGPARRGVSPDDMPSDLWPAQRPGHVPIRLPPGDRGSSGPSRVRHGTVSLRAISQAGRRDRSDSRPGGGCTSGANTRRAGLASRNRFARLNLACAIALTVATRPADLGEFNLRLSTYCHARSGFGRTGMPPGGGQTEGHINRLKTLKRAMYGRAGAELLRARMLPLQLSIQHGK